METYRAAVCEDDPGSLTYIKEKLHQTFLQYGLSVTLSDFTNPQKLLSSVQAGQVYEILFLDIDMPNMNGIELCREIQKQLSDVLVVFVSNKEELVFQTFAVRPFRFIRKSFFDGELPGIAADLRAELERRSALLLALTDVSNHTVYSFDVHQVMYAEAEMKHCRIVMPQRSIRLQYRFKELENLLQPHGFLRCHRSYLVNARFIFQIQKDSLILDDRTVLPVSRGRAEITKKEFMSLLNGKGWTDVD